MFSSIYSNPLNLYGQSTSLEDILQHPLQPNEIVMQDSKGGFHRIIAPQGDNDTYIRRGISWIQTSVNTTSHLEAMKNLISQFEEQVVKTDVMAQETLTVIQNQAAKLKDSVNFSARNEGSDLLVLQLQEKLTEITEIAEGSFKTLMQAETELLEMMTADVDSKKKEYEIQKKLETEWKLTEVEHVLEENIFPLKNFTAELSNCSSPDKFCLIADSAINHLQSQLSTLITAWDILKDITTKEQNAYLLQNIAGLVEKLQNVTSELSTQVSIVLDQINYHSDSKEFNIPTSLQAYENEQESLQSQIQQLSERLNVLDNKLMIQIQQLNNHLSL